jgi:hypothetical protein
VPLSQWNNFYNFEELDQFFKEDKPGLFALVPTIQRFLPDETKLKIVINLFRLTNQEKVGYVDVDFVGDKANLLEFLANSDYPFPYNQDLLQDVFDQDEVNAYFWNHPLSFGAINTTLSSKIEDFYSYYLVNRRIMLRLSSKRPIDNAFDGANDLNLKSSVKLRTFAVGQANFSGLFYGHSRIPKCVFDLGCKDASNLNTKRFHAIDSDGYIVISHFDSDHINGFKYLQPRAYQRKFIMPSLPNVPFSATLISFVNEIAAKTNLNPNIYLIPNGAYQTSPYQLQILGRPVSIVDIYTGVVQRNGYRADPYQSTAENARGLICNISTVGGDKQALVPGDALYGNFPTRFSPSYLFVPHHGCDYGQSIQTINPAVLEKAVVLCSYNGHLGYHHPNLSHYKILLKLKKGHRWFRFIQKRSRPLIFNGAVPLRDHHSLKTKRSCISFKLN